MQDGQQGRGCVPRIAACGGAMERPTAPGRNGCREELDDADFVMAFRINE